MDEVASNRGAVFDDTVVGEDSAVLLEGVDVFWAQPAGGGAADMGDERAGQAFLVASWVNCWSW